MPSGKNRKKAKRNQALLAHAGEITDNYQEPSGSTGDPSRSRINDFGDNLSNRAGNASDNQLAVPGNHRDLPSPAPAGQISHDDFASTLSAISPSQSGVETTGITGGNAEHVGRIAPSDSVRASGRDNSRVPTVEAVTDDEDIAPSRQSSVPSKATSRRSGSSPEFVHSVIPPSPQLSNKSRTVSTRSSESSRMPPSSSPYPQRRKGKQRRNRADSIESAEMCIAAARSLAERPKASDAESNPRPNNWDDINLCLAADALARERGKNESNSVYQRRVAAWKRNERQLRVGREADDLALAEELQVREVMESEDFALATAIEAKQRSDARQARLQAAAAQHAIDREEEEAARLEMEAAAKRALTDKRREILNDYLHEKHVSAAARSDAQSTQANALSGDTEGRDALGT
ncbi:hypothetical protein B0H17DRAFT_1150038 [Mycena rosella]|uniref:Uncharacterized protein n=1 Tax=Mycena rosella TaxID=1033263 RepID=A0AAD7BVR4_MYCRO|nr:hypothetical protein B0H17DRAFT_1150038 [Mycena rosella]